ncbi:MAG: peptidoglycan-binding protein, partial [Thiohalocapsa sp.]
DRSQDISPTQLLVLLDVAERTGYSLGQLLATGEHESAHTWNDFVRPRLSSGRLGRAAGVWQFQPKTFERIIHLYGAELLALTAADPAAGRRRLDLGFGPFCDSHVRLVIRDTMAGLRDPSDPELKLLRHNFTILALAKYLLSKDSGATNPVEDYLFHFLGPAQGRRILALAQGDARHTRTVKPPPPPDPPTAAGGTSRVRDTLPGRPELLLELAPRGYRSLTPGAPTPGTRAADAMLRRQDEPAPKPPQPPPPQWRADYGYPHDSPVVTSNAGMFYRDGQARSDPYTWAEFLRHLERRVKADRQPELVRAKYGVGFYLEGGDMPHRAFNPDAPGSGDGATLSVRLDDGTTRDLPRAQILEPLDTREMRDYQRRLAALIGLGDAEPTAVLSDAAALALWRLGLLEPPSHATEPAADPADLLGTDMGLGWGTVLRTDEPTVRRALHAFRSLVGKAAPENPAHSDLLLPAERVALEVYGARIERMLAAERGD